VVEVTSWSPKLSCALDSLNSGSQQQTATGKVLVSWVSLNAKVAVNLNWRWLFLSILLRHSSDSLKAYLLTLDWSSSLTLPLNLNSTVWWPNSFSSPFNGLANSVCCDNSTPSSNGVFTLLPCLNLPVLEFSFTKRLKRMGRNELLTRVSARRTSPPVMACPMSKSLTSWPDSSTSKTDTAAECAVTVVAATSKVSFLENCTTNRVMPCLFTVRKKAHLFVWFGSNTHGNSSVPTTPSSIRHWYDTSALDWLRLVSSIWNGCGTKAWTYPKLRLAVASRQETSFTTLMGTV
jgi:hypothetical protein